MDTNNVHCTYTSEKISKIRWRPEALGDPHSFVTAGWDNDINHIKLWEIQEHVVDEDLDVSPYEITGMKFEGDATELKFINSERFVVSSTNGNIFHIKIATSETGKIDFCEEVKWQHGNATTFTTFALYLTDVATCGSDGRINLLTISNKAPVKTFSDTLSVNCADFLKHNELLTANSAGMMKVWDLRGNCEKADVTFAVRTDKMVSASCLAHHPTQRHIVIAGDEEGSITFWDLRQNTYPLNVITSHEDDVTEAHFHPDKPEHLFSCSLSGDLLHWRDSKKQPGGYQADVWYMSATATKRCEAFKLLPQLHTPINSLDLNRDRILCGTDMESLYLIEKIDIYN